MRRQGSGQALIEYVVLLALAYSQVSALRAYPAAAIVPTQSPTPTPDARHDTGPDAHASDHEGGNGHSHN
jgi:hypothetical protein